MQEHTYNEKKNKRAALIVSVGVHLLLLLLVSSLVTCHRSQVPPWPPQSDIGIALNHGVADQGSGDEAQQTDDSSEEPVEEQDEVDEVETDVDAEDTPDDEALPERETDTPVKTTPSDETSVDQQQTTQQSSSQGTDDSDDETTSGEGDDKTGDDDKGVNDGIDESNLYTGDHGGGDDGLELDINGWNWKNTPEFDPMPHGGQVKVSFVVNDLGRVRSVKVLSSSYTPDQLDKIEKKIKEIVFEQTSSSGRPSRETPGTLTIKFKEK